MRINDHSGSDPKCHAKNNVGRFSRDSGKGEQFFHRARNFSMKLVYNFFGGSFDVLSFVSEESGASDFFFNLSLRSFRKPNRSGKFFKQPGGHFVDALIGALGR